MYGCPLANECDGSFATHAGLLRHWKHIHARTHGSYQAPWANPTLAGESKASASEDPLPPVPPPVPSIAATAMAHIDRIKYQHYSTDADVARVKAMVRDCLVTAISGGAVDGNDPSSFARPILDAFDNINSRRREATARRHASAQKHPPLSVYPRALGQRGMGKRKRGSDDTAYAYDTRWEEVL